MIRLLDSSALLAFLRQEPGDEVVDRLLKTEDCYVHAVNLCEVYYDVRRVEGELTAEATLNRVIDLGVVIRDDLDISFWKKAGGYKADLRRVSLADCFCAALANRLDAEVITADHEFDAIERKGVCAVRFIR